MEPDCHSPPERTLQTLNPLGGWSGHGGAERFRMALIETAIGVVVAVALTALTIAMIGLTVMSLRDDVHSPATQPETVAAGDIEDPTHQAVAGDG